MNATDFHTWLQRHRDLFPGIEKYLNQGSEDSRDARESAWGRILRAVSLEDAEAVTDIMLENPSRQPRQHNHWIGRVKEIALEFAKDRSQGDAQYESGPTEWRCEYCRDVGQVTVWKSTIPGAEDVKFYYTMHHFRVDDTTVYLACECEKGSYRLNNPRYPYLNKELRFEPGVHEIYTSKGALKRFNQAEQRQAPAPAPEPTISDDELEHMECEMSPFQGEGE